MRDKDQKRGEKKVMNLEEKTLYREGKTT